MHCCACRWDPTAGACGRAAAGAAAHWRARLHTGAPNALTTTEVCGQRGAAGPAAGGITADLPHQPYRVVRLLQGLGHLHSPHGLGLQCGQRWALSRGPGWVVVMQAARATTHLGPPAAPGWPRLAVALGGRIEPGRAALRLGPCVAMGLSHSALAPQGGPRPIRRHPQTHRSSWPASGSGAALPGGCAASLHRLRPPEASGRARHRHPAKERELRGWKRGCPAAGGPTAPLLCRDRWGPGGRGNRGAGWGRRLQE